MSTSIVAFIFIFCAIVFIAVGRFLVRKARRANARAFHHRLVGWGFLFLGLFFMILGVLTW